jgi:hypothetical protein
MVSHGEEMEKVGLCMLECATPAHMHESKTCFPPKASTTGGAAGKKIIPRRYGRGQDRRKVDAQPPHIKKLYQASYRCSLSACSPIVTFYTNSPSISRISLLYVVFNPYCVCGRPTFYFAISFSAIRVMISLFRVSFPPLDCEYTNNLSFVNLSFFPARSCSPLAYLDDEQGMLRR